MNIELFRTLSEAAGVPGREERIRDIVTHNTQGWWDEQSTDPMGNVICRKRGPDGAPKVMIACHLDEIGFYVRYIEEGGFLRVQNVGGFDTRNLFSRRVRVHTADGDLLGVMNPAGKPIHLASDDEKKKTPEVSDFYIDLLLPEDQVKQRVRIGDPVTLVQSFIEIGDNHGFVTGKALDNRSAVFVGLSAVEPFCRGQKQSKYDIYWVGSVQEEVGLRGAQTAAGRIQPDIGIAIDTTLACDTPGTSKHDHVTKLGQGVGIKIMDASAISNRALVDEFIAIATRDSIPHQLELLPRGGTDQGTMQRAMSGCRSITLSIPTRYIHTTQETQSKKDVQATIDVLTAWLGT